MKTIIINGRQYKLTVLQYEEKAARESMGFSYTAITTSNVVNKYDAINIVNIDYNGIDR